MRNVTCGVATKGIALRKQSSERIDEIVRVATEVIGERGFFGMTIQEVADRTGLSQAACKEQTEPIGSGIAAI